MQIHVKSLVLLWINLNIQIQADEFVYEYFRYKDVTRVTLFSCEESENDFRFLRKMNGLGIFASVTHPNRENYDVSVERIARKDSRSFGLILDTRCQNRRTTEKIITQTSQSRLYAGIHIWLILASSLNEIMELLNDTEYSLLTDLTIGVETKTGYDLFDVYNPCKIRGGSLNITELGFWHVKKGLNITLTQLKFTRRSNLMGMKIKVVSVVKYQPPDKGIAEHLEDYATKSLDPISKYGWAIARQIEDLYNYTMEVQTVGDWIVTINGTEQGMMPMLDRGEVDIGVSPCSATLRYAAKPYGRMLMPGYPYRTFFIFLSDEAEKLKWMELMTPFAFNAWCAIFLTGIVSVVIITTIQMSEYGEGWFTESGHAIFAIIGTLSQQGLAFVPNRLAGRIAFLFLLFLGVLLSNYYGASVVSARLNEPLDKMNDSLYSLAKSRMTVTSEPFRNVDDNLAFRATFDWEVRYFNDKVWTKLSDSRYVKPAEGLAKVANGRYAYHTSAEVAYPYVEANWDDKAICAMTEVHVIDPRILSFWERVDSPFAEITKNGLIKTANTGLRMRTIKRWKPKTPYCSPDARSLQSITIFDIAPAIIVVFGGTVLSIIIYAFELFIFKYCPELPEAQRAVTMQRIVGKKTLQRRLKE